MKLNAGYFISYKMLKREFENSQKPFTSIFCPIFNNFKCMKTLLIIFTVLFFGLLANCQDNSRYPLIPDEDAVSTTSLASFIKSHYTTDKQKFEAAYYWVIQNIKYDKDSMYNINWNQGNEAIITEAMRRRKGVCENYAAIFCNIVTKTGLSAFAVQGYTRQNGMTDKTDHTWCATMLDGEWLLCDPTWDYGQHYSLNYFMVDPGTFIQTHIPYDPMWQLKEYPISHAEFNGAATTIKHKTVFNFRDSIMKFNQLNELQKLEKTASRMTVEANVNQLIRNRLSYMRMLIAIEYQEEDLKMYNDAVLHLNKANYFYNQYLSFRNNGFSPPIAPAKIYNLLDSVSKQLVMAKSITNSMEKRIASYQFDPGTLNERITSLNQKLETAYEFLKNNFASIKEKQ